MKFNRRTSPVRQVTFFQSHISIITVPLVSEKSFSQQLQRMLHEGSTGGCALSQFLLQCRSLLCHIGNKRASCSSLPLAEMISPKVLSIVWKQHPSHIVPDVWGDPRWMGRRHGGHRPRRNRPCTYRSHCQQRAQQYHHPWLAAEEERWNVSTAGHTPATKPHPAGGIAPGGSSQRGESQWCTGLMCGALRCLGGLPHPFPSCQSLHRFARRPLEGAAPSRFRQRTDLGQRKSLRPLALLP